VTRITKTFVFWSPRLLTFIFAVFVSLFALDVFGEKLGFWQTLLALLIHLIPTYIILVILALAWRWEWIGSLLFVGLGVFYIFMTNARFPLAAYFLMSGPLFVIGFLFLLNWLFRTKGAM
jgi:hypothetical protein